jgi:hypothetical protein
MKEWNRTDVQGLSIINHQRNIPALDRETPFRDVVRDEAEAQDIGLLSTWELFKLLRGSHRWEWDERHLKPLFYRKGIIEGIPEHYEYVGKVERYMQKEGNRIVGIRVEVEVNCEDRISFVLPTEFYEQDVESLQIDNADVETASKGDIVATTTGLTKEQAKAGLRVYRVCES